MSTIRLIKTILDNMFNYGTRPRWRVLNEDIWRQKKSIENALCVSSECSRGKGLKDCAAQKDYAAQEIMPPNNQHCIT